MAILKCKMCGGDLQISENQNYATCEYCGSTMTLPKASDERKVNLFNRANHFRRMNEFDKTLTIYENILNDDNTDAEAHWGVVLCRYGIEYVEDPTSQERIPTCHRAQYDSILNDADFLAALENAPDGYSRSLYEAEAKRISEIQKDILAISKNEEPFDVFICYKESSESGTRTKDSTIAQDIYFQLTQANYKVFFSRITLEDKLGRAYEPYIFAALNSAKVMVVVGTSTDNFNAVWVKNEWSRYLALSRKDRNKLIIPCYRDMDAYELPEELSYLQSQDMGKIGFIQDLIRGIKKVISSSKTNHSATPQTSESGYIPSEKPLLDRAFLCLEDGEFEKADILLEQVLNMNPRQAKAYVGKLMVELNVCLENNLPKSPKPLTEFNAFNKAIRFADSDYRSELQNYDKMFFDRIEQDVIEKKQQRINEEIEKEQQRINTEDSDISLADTTKGYGRLIVHAGDWIYFTLEGIYKMKVDGTELSKISETHADFICLSDGWIFGSASSYEFADGVWIWRMRSDGTEMTYIAQYGNGAAYGFQLEGEWLYFCSPWQIADEYIPESENGSGGIYKMKIDGSEFVKIAEGNIYFSIVDKDWLYFGTEYFLSTEDLSKYSFYKIHNDGTSATQIASEDWSAIADSYLPTYEEKVPGDADSFVCEVETNDQFIYYFVEFYTSMSPLADPSTDSSYYDRKLMRMNEDGTAMLEIISCHLIAGG